MAKTYVKRQDTDEVVETINVDDSRCTFRHLERLERGVLLDMDTDSFYYDDKEAMEVAKKNSEAKR